MLFCPKCGSILKPVETKEGRVLKCPRCGYVSDKKEARISEAIKDKKKIEVVEKKEILPKTKEKCPKCGNDEAYYWEVQTRAGDEAATKFYKCTKCSHVWRDYG